MNIEHLMYFKTVAEYGSINKAAHALYISQPHLGNIVRDLEDELDVKLLQRTRHGVSLTAEGTEFLAHAEKMLEEYQDICRIKTGSGRSSGNSLVISMTKFSHIMESFINVVLAHRDDPAFAHQLNEGSPEDVIEDVYSGMSQIGVLNFDTERRDWMMAKLKDKHLDYYYLAEFEPNILVADDHPLLKEGKPVDLANLADYGFVRYIGQYEDFTNRIRSEQGEQNLNQSRRIVYTHGRSTLLHLIGKSDFYGIGIHDFSMQESAYNVRSIPIEGCSASLEFGYILPEGKEPSAVTREFVADLTARFTKIKV